MDVAIEVTEQVQARKKIEESQQRFYSLANSITQLAWIADEHGWIFWYNERWFEYTGTTLEEMQGWGWEKVHHPDHKERVVSFVKEAWQRYEPFELIFPLRRHDGEYRWFLTRVVPVRNKEGAVVQWIGTNTDIEDQKQAETLLEERVQDRTQQLEQKNKELEQFAYAASHDMQEPLRKIAMFSNVLLDSHSADLNESGKAYLGKICASAKRMKLLIDDLLQYSYEPGEEQRFEPTDLNTIIEEITSDLEVVIERKGALIKTGELPTVMAVPNQMHQLFYNLITNALKFSKPDVPPEITVCVDSKPNEDVLKTNNLDPSKTYVQINVRDNGIGFDPKHVEEVFSLFKRLHGKNDYEGTGIGLSLVKKVVSNHSGKIWAESTPGEGASFKMLLQKE